MKQRILIMNKQRLVQSEQEGQWVTNKIEKAGDMKAGIYNLYLATDADKAKTSIGVILHTDKDYVYQQDRDGKRVIRHALDAFNAAPPNGAMKNISYEDDRAIAVTSSEKISRGIKH